jgi:glycosyltransferase involved in cell wall biosynthesis
VSILMAVYNEERFLGEAVESALAQEYPDFEIVISDDGSTDSTRGVAEGFARSHPDRVRVVHGDANEGKPAALNRALEVHTGELICWLDGDDVMLPGKLERQVALLERHPEAVGTVHDAEMFESETGRVIGRFSEVAGQPLRSGGVELWFDPTHRMLPSATMFRSAARPPHGFDGRISFANDWLFDIELFTRGRCVVLDEVLVRYRRHAGSFTDRAQSGGLDFEEGLMVMSIVEARYPQHVAGVKTCRTALLAGEARRRAARRDMRGAARYAGAALRDGGIGGGLGVARSLAGSSLRRRLAR